MEAVNSRVRRSAALFGLAAAIAFPGCCGCCSSAPLRDLSLLPADETVALFRKEESAVSTLQAEVRARIESPKRSGTLQAVILVRRPNAFRMRAYPRLFGGTVFDLAILKDRIEFFLPSEETVYVQRLGGGRSSKVGEGGGTGGPKGGRGEGEKGGENGMARQAPGEKMPDLDALFGSTSLARMILGTTVEDEGEIRYMGEDSDGIRLAVVGADGVVEGYVWLDPVQRLKRRQVVFGEGGKTVLALAFEDWELHEPTGFCWPGSIEIHAPKDDFRLEMTFSAGDLTLNDPIDEDAFDLDLPEGTRRVEREGEGN